MPISLILTPFDHFQIRPTFAVTPNLILEPCLSTVFNLENKNGKNPKHCFRRLWIIPRNSFKEGRGFGIGALIHFHWNVATIIHFKMHTYFLET